jgi:hypothetical protein
MAGACWPSSLLASQCVRYFIKYKHTLVACTAQRAITSSSSYLKDTCALNAKPVGLIRMKFMAMVMRDDDRSRALTS